MSQCARLLCLLVVLSAVSITHQFALATDNPAELQSSGPSVSEFLTPDGRFDLEAARASGFEGSIDLRGFNSSLDPVTGEPVFAPTAAGAAMVPDDVYWEEGYGLPGLDNTVRASAVFSGSLIVGGDFQIAGASQASRIASWDGVSWSPLGLGVNNAVRALTVFNSQLIAAGDFSSAGGVLANRIAAWDGSSWSALGTGMNLPVLALTVFNSQLIAGGSFSTAGGTSASRIAAWDGSSWTALGTGMNNNVLALTEFNSQLIAAGTFSTAGGVSASQIAAWDGTNWSALGSGTNSTVFALTVFNSELIAGGTFSNAGGMPANCIASWDGSTWSALGTGTNVSVLSLTVFDSQLIVGGNLTTAGGTSANRIAAWDGSSWSALGAGTNNVVYALITFNSQLISGGGFTIAGEAGASRIAAWDGLLWSPLYADAKGMNGPVRGLTVFNSQIIAGGDFNAAGGLVANRVAAWNGSSWSALGTGTSGTVEALTVFDSRLIAGGSFITAGGMAANWIAAWDGSSWSPLGTGTNGTVEALTVFNSRLIAGGSFTIAGGIAVNRIAAWDGSSWFALGTGMNNTVHALTVFNSQLVAGGQFTTADGATVNRIAVWNGSSWSGLGTGVSNIVWALTAFNSQLIAGGEFTTAGGVSANRIAAWDGSSWSAIGTGMNNLVASLTVFNSRLIAGGLFTTAGGVTAPRVAAWDGSSWSALGSGVNSTVFALTEFDSHLFAGGVFTVAGEKVSAYIAEWTKPACILTIDCPPDTTIECDESTDPASTGTASYTSIPGCGAVTITHADVITPGACDDSWTITRTWTATPTTGDPVQCVQTITVVDTTRPIITCPGDLRLERLADVPPYAVGDASATDNCDLSLNLSGGRTDNAEAGCPDDSLVIADTFIATDNCGNADTCVRIIVVIDETPPNISCPPGFAVECVSEIPACNPGDATASDTNGIANLTCSDGPLVGGPCGGTITRTYTATDPCGNQSSCDQIITVHDLTAPVFALDCPGNVNLQCASDVPASVAVDATDNCEGVMNILPVRTSNGGAGCDHDPLVITDTYTATDACGNSAQCIKTFTVIDDTAPTVSCPTDFAVGCIDDVPACNPADAVASDNCGSVNVACSDAPLVGGPQGGTITRTFIATDDCGNADTCSLLITVGPSSRWFEDADDDSYGSLSSPLYACTQPVGYVADSTDCDDGNQAVNPGAIEVCNGLDDNCDLQIDEGDVCCACDCHTDPVCDAVINDVQDVVATINVAFRGAAAIPDPNGGCPFETTDMNCDGVTAVIDVVKVVNVAFRGANTATEYCDPCP